MDRIRVIDNLLRTYEAPMNPTVPTTLTKAKETARLDDSGIELLTHATMTTHVT